MRKRKILLLVIILITSAAFLGAHRYRKTLSQSADVQSQLIALEGWLGSFAQITPDNDSFTSESINMNIVNINGRSYVGIIRFPNEEISLPVLSEKTSSRQDLYPVLSSGSVKLNDLLIDVEGSGPLFAPTENLSIGESASFTDMAGSISHYQIERIESRSTWGNNGSDFACWDLTLLIHAPGETACTAVCCKSV